MTRLLALAFLLPVAAVAQTPVIVAAAPPSALTEALDQALITVLGAAAIALTVIIKLAVDRLKQKWTVQAVAQNTANLNSDVHTSIAAGIAQLPPDLAKAEWHDPLKQTAILATSASYMEQHFPDRVKEITGQIPSAVPSAVLHEVIAARLPAAIAVAAASPATPEVKG